MRATMHRGDFPNVCMYTIIMLYSQPTFIFMNKNKKNIDEIANTFSRIPTYVRVPFQYNMHIRRRRHI